DAPRQSALRVPQLSGAASNRSGDGRRRVGDPRAARPLAAAIRRPASVGTLRREASGLGQGSRWLLHAQLQQLSTVGQGLVGAASALGCAEAALGCAGPALGCAGPALGCAGPALGCAGPAEPVGSGVAVAWGARTVTSSLRAK